MLSIYVYGIEPVALNKMTVVLTRGLQSKGQWIQISRKYLDSWGGKGL